MGKAKDRLNPKVKTAVDRNLLVLFTKALKKIVWGLPVPWETNGKGRPSHDPRIIVVLCVLKVAFCLTYDSLEAIISKNSDVKNILGVKKLPGHSVVHRGMQKLSMKYIRKLFKKTLCKASSKTLVLIVDATGFRLRTSSKWYDVRIKRKTKRKDFLKLHIVVNRENRQILAFFCHKRHKT